MTQNFLLIPLVQNDIVMYDSTIELTDDPQETHIYTILDHKKESCDKICNMVYRRNIFIMKLKIKEEYAHPGRIMDEKSSEHWKSLKKEQTSGVHFKVTGGDNLIPDEMLIGYKLVERK